MNKLLKRVIFSAVSASLATILIGAGLLNKPDSWVQDALYQQGGYNSSEIVIIGYDEKALSRFGPYNTWDRNIVASALEKLAEDPERMPAVVAIDTLYIGETDPAADERLSLAAENLGNVVTATAAQFGTTHQYSDGTFTTDTFSIIGYEEPYEALRNVTVQGHINAMEDTDGIMRHALLYIDTDSRVYSMAAQTAKIYLNAQGKEISYPDVNSRGHFYVPFTSEPRTYYDGISLADIVDGNVSPDYWAGKIVLIGPYASGLQDAYFTPISKSTQMFGVEFQANVIQSLIDGNFKTELSEIPQVIVLFVLLFAGMYIFTGKSVAAGGVTCGILSAASLLVSYLAYTAGLVTHAIWIPVGAVILYTVAVARHYFEAAAERRHIYSTFERYVAPEVVRELMREGTDSLGLGGQLCDVAVLFVDVRGFTTMSERLDPETVVYILNKILTMTSSCVANHGGTLDKFVGDATMAFWGAPLPCEDASYHASLAALQIVEESKIISNQLKEEIGEEIHVGVGVHYGPAVIGNIGSAKRMDYTAIGDTVNTSARLEANAPGDTVYISRIVAEQLGERASVTSLGDTVKLKGKAEGFEVLLLNSLEEK